MTMPTMAALGKLSVEISPARDSAARSTASHHLPSQRKLRQSPSSPT